MRMHVVFAAVPSDRPVSGAVLSGFDGTGVSAASDVNVPTTVGRRLQLGIDSDKLDPNVDDSSSWKHTIQVWRRDPAWIVSTF
jgi:hypothetical protein